MLVLIPVLNKKAYMSLINPSDDSASELRTVRLLHVICS